MRETAKTETILSPWVTLMARTVDRCDGSQPGVYHSLKQADYVAVLGITSGGLMPVVFQYRPACRGITCELPAGLLEEGEAPVDCARRELAEEAGFDAAGPMEELGVLRPDNGRLENRLWCFFVTDIQPIAGWQPEPGIETRCLDRDGLMRAIASGRFDHAQHVAAVGLAVMRGLL